MQEKTLQIPFCICTDAELQPAERALAEAARQATYTSYSPYSHFCVGAAVLLSNGETICGSNQENAAFGAVSCAERTALFYAHAHFPTQAVKAIAIAARGTDGGFTPQPCAPCGICRQALMEAQKRAGAPIRVIMVGRDNSYVVDGIESILPFAFEEIV